MSAVYDWQAEGDFPTVRVPVADAVRLALVDLAAGRLPSLRTLRRAVGVDSARALALRDHLAHLIVAERLGLESGGANAPVDRAEGEPTADRLGDAFASPPASTPEPDPACPRALAEFGGELAEGRVPSQRQIRLRLRVGSPRASRIRGFLAAHARRAA